MNGLQRQPLFAALARPQMFAGVTYNYFVLNAIITMEAFLITKSFWVAPLALVIHVIGCIVCAREPRFFDLWLLRVQRCPRVPNFAYWGVNSYAP